MNNTRFATVMHILTLLDHNASEWSTSDWIAGSININPVVVRKELSILQEAGLVTSKKGKVGGSMLGKKSSEILLADIYRIVRKADVLGKKNLHTNPQCPVGKRINVELETLFEEVDAVVLKFLAGKTLKDFSGQFV
ncbi:Rrf2 family transcriptional regulator [Sphingobacterium sp. LRF_L2]|uniref:Rrf2 family transcriptional regulator n=1 Tax=Sphingobacterium sp. LRF_L2 TaxID=3369421 RepID=UPI003F636099